MNYSLTMAGILVAVGVPVLANLGLTDACSNEVVNLGIKYVFPLIGGVMAWIGRHRVGDVNVAGFKK